MSEERIKALEEKVVLQSVKLDSHDKEFSSIARSLESISAQMIRTNDLFHELALVDERARAELVRLEQLLAARVDTVITQTALNSSRVQSIENIINKIVWAIVGFMGIGLLSAAVNFY